MSGSVTSAALDHRNRTWAEAAGQVETAARLEHLPTGLAFPDNFPEPIRYDAAGKRLVYRGFMGSTSYRFLHGLSVDSAYVAALDQLFMGSAYAAEGRRRTWPWVLLGTATLLGSAALAWVLLHGV